VIRIKLCNTINCTLLWLFPYATRKIISFVRQAGPLLTKAIEEDNYEELIDPKLEANYDAYDMARLIACAAAAVRQTARSRPRMTHVSLPRQRSHVT
jgi:hypothetical protein